MAETRIRSLPEAEAIDQIVETIQGAEPAAAPFALVLGSGFSHGLVPTARELVETSLPIWMKSKCRDEVFEQLLKGSLEEHNSAARDFWKRFVESNATRNLQLTLDPRTGLPEDYAAAYRAAFDPTYKGAVGQPAQARKFQRRLMRLEQPRLNAAHFLLASLLGVQPRKTRPSPLFKAESAFCRLILTTNFDPFLQTALQSVNRLYLMSDTPELGVTDEISDDHTDAIHLVYLHGSIHRRLQATTEKSISRIKEENARTLASVLKRRGVIVLGYSGWDDVIVEALGECDEFDHLLYWCGREANPLQKGAFGPRVAEILHKPAAAYVRIRTAGHFMAQIYTRLVEGLPRLLGNPIGQLQEMLETIDLSELDSLTPSSSVGALGPEAVIGGADHDVFVDAKRAALERLTQAEQGFLNPGSRRGGKKEALSQPADLGAEVGQWVASARVATALGNHVEAVKIYTRALELSSSESGERAALLLSRGQAFYVSGKMDDALSDWTEVSELPDASVEQKATALKNRGVSWRDKGDTDRSIAEYTRAIEQLPGAPVQYVADALLGRGFTWHQKGDLDRALADYTHVIEQLPDPPVEQMAWALFNRGVTWQDEGDLDRAVADYTRIIEQLRDAGVEQVASALLNRGVVWRRKGDTDKAIADYTRIAEQLPDAPIELKARALRSRGLAWRQAGDTDKAIADYTRVAEQLPGAPIEEVAEALFSRGLDWDVKGDTDKSIADYTRIAEQLPGAPVELKARALISRGLAWSEMGYSDMAIADYTGVAEQLPGARVDKVARALIHRGLTWGETGDLEKEIADYSRVLELQGAPAEQLADALVNRGFAWGEKGNSDQLIMDCTQVVEHLPGARPDQVAEALLIRGEALGEKGETDEELADYTRVIEQLSNASVEQVARALANRGWAHYEQNNPAAFLKDTESALSKNPALDYAAFNLGIALLANNRDEDAIAAYQRAMQQFPDSPESLHILEARKTWLTPERAEPILRLLQPQKSSAMIKQ